MSLSADELVARCVEGLCDRSGCEPSVFGEIVGAEGSWEEGLIVLLEVGESSLPEGEVRLAVGSLAARILLMCDECES